MGVAAGPKVVTEGLVFSLDVGNVFKSTDSTVNNFLQNGSFAGGLGVTYEGESNPTNTIVELKNPGDSNYVLRQNGSNTEYQMNIDGGAQGTLSANTQYVMSGWYAKSPDYNGGDTMFHARAYSSSGAHIATGNGIGTLLYSIEVGGLTWEYRYQTISTPVDYSGGFDWYMGYGTTNTTGYRYYTGLKVEEGSFPSLVDLSRNGNDANLINGVGYDSANGGSLSFDGVNDYISTPITGTFSQITFEFYGFFDDPTLSTTSRNESAFGDWTSNRVHFGTRWSVGMHFNVNSVWQQTPATNLRYGWNHYVLVYDTVNNLKRVYLNGILSSSHGTNGNMVLGDFRIGVATNLNQYYRGNISNFKAYNRALTASEIQQNFNATRGRFDI